MPDIKCNLFKGGEDYISISLHLGNKSGNIHRYHIQKNVHIKHNILDSKYVTQSKDTRILC